MNSLRNSVKLIGNLGSDPEVKTLEGGNKMAKFSLATNDGYRNSNGDWVKDTQWHQVVAWGKTAEIVEKFLSKGNEIVLEGKLTSRVYDDKEGVRRYITEVTCHELLVLD